MLSNTLRFPTIVFNSVKIVHFEGIYYKFSCPFFVVNFIKTSANEMANIYRKVFFVSFLLSVFICYLCFVCVQIFLFPFCGTHFVFYPLYIQQNKKKSSSKMFRAVFFCPHKQANRLQK